ncbi:hypothetical protein BHE74_00026151 [Ensete ventricosum]|nr:hypothetical protein BHE74_00026151 [Ensete ventricosum]
MVTTSYVSFIVAEGRCALELRKSAKATPPHMAACEKAADASAETGSPSPPPPQEKARDDKGDVVSVELPAPTGWKKKVRFL